MELARDLSTKSGYLPFFFYFSLKKNYDDFLVRTKVQTKEVYPVLSLSWIKSVK